MEKGTLIIRNSGSGYIKENKKSIPKEFTPVSKEYNEKQCEYEVNENGKITKIFVDGKELKPNEAKILKKIEAEKKKKIREEIEEKKKKEILDNKSLIDFYENDFVDMSKTFLPTDTINLLRDNRFKMENFALNLNKAARFEANKFHFFKAPYKKDRGFTVKEKFNKIPVSEIAENNLKAAKRLIGEPNIYSTNLKPDWRMVVGLGGESVYETSMTLHHIYGIPYIPASSIKGVVRSWIIYEYFGNPETKDKDNKSIVPEEEKDFPLVNAEYRANKNDAFCYWFGCSADTEKVVFENNVPRTRTVNGKEKYDTEKHKTKLHEIWHQQNKKFSGHIGTITFFDAFPLKLDENSIVVDIMNPHYGDYYNKDGVAPTDFLSPNPIPFLTVENTKFQFIIGSKNVKLEEYKIGEHSIDWWLKQALENHGIGAKTAVGYGRMK